MESMFVTEPLGINWMKWSFHAKKVDETDHSHIMRRKRC